MKKIQKNFEDYYLGLDLGTSSVGWAVTNQEYDLLKSHGKLLWGTRLFPEAKTAAERRVFRSSRRRLKRRKERIKLLQMIFSEEIAKVDIGFFQRLEDSKYHMEDKSIFQKNTLFFDEDYTDKDYHQEFPTIYHLRKFLLEGKKPKDIRHLYLALHHILSHRGHFLFEDMNVENVTDFSNSFESFQKYLREEFEIDFSWKKGKEKEVEEILKSVDRPKSEKEKLLVALVDHSEKKLDKQRQAMVGLMCGTKKKFSELFDEEDYKDLEIKSISFQEISYEEQRDQLEELLGEKILCLDYLKAIFDWAKLADILSGEKSISVAKVKSYEEHKKDLTDLKHILRSYSKKESMTFWKDKAAKVNYLQYIAGKCSQEELNKEIKKILSALKVEEKDLSTLEALKKKAENNRLLPKQVVKDNGVIPRQIHEYELKTILEKMRKYFPFLEVKDGECSNEEKLIKIFHFRIPYYVGPLNNSHDRAWIVKREKTKIYPWNFEQVVDIEASAEKFIENLTNKCTYLPTEDVLAKSSLLYSRFMVLNELNNLRVNGEKISVEWKQKIYEGLFQKEKKVTQKKLRDFLKRSNYGNTKEMVFTGIDGDFKSNLASYIDFARILSDKIQTEKGQKIAEDCIRWITIYPSEEKLLKKKIKTVYGDVLSEEQIKQISKLKYKDWGRLSYTFLEKISSHNPETGEVLNIIRMMWETKYNLMELLSRDFDFTKEMEEFNGQGEKGEEFSYDSIMKDTYFSPPVKRTIWQTLRIVKELRQITGKDPKKIFIEMARQEEKDKKRKDSRKDSLIALYKAIKEDKEDLLKSLETQTNDSLKSKKLYLYYTQMGRCMYSGDPIPFDSLKNENLWDIDHIHPRARRKDDSFDNLCLVKKELNSKKGDTYPFVNMEELSISRKTKEFWKFLQEKGFISQKKLERLTRIEEFTDDELANFIARQLVETRQSTKAVADILKSFFPNTKIVYVKASLVSEFRQEFKIVKSRDINDYHHAHDAYLNIVTGNVYNTKFTDNPRKFIEDRKVNNRRYNLTVKSVFTENDKYSSVWNEAMFEKIKNFIFNKKPIVTYYSYRQNGQLFNQTIITKEISDEKKGYIPLKSSDIRLQDIKKYGSYTSVAGSHFFLVEHTDKKNRIKTIETIPIYLRNNLNNTKVLEEYCIKELGLNMPRVCLEEIKYYSLLKIDGFFYYITSKSVANRISLLPAVQLMLEKDWYEYLRKLYKSRERNKIMEEVTEEKNKEFLKYIIHKLENSIYSRKKMSIKHKNIDSATQQVAEITKKLSQILKDESANIQKMDILEQTKVLIECVSLLEARVVKANLSTLNASDGSGEVKISNKVDKLEEIWLINQSVTGVYESYIDLKKV